MLQMTLLGTSGMCPLPNRALASCFVRISGVGFLIDCGEGTQVELQRRKIVFGDIDYLLITHLHADHISGMLGILLAMDMQGRQKPLKIFGPKGLKSYIMSFERFIRGIGFKYDVEEIESVSTYNLPSNNSASKIKLKVGLSEHSVRCYCYSLELIRNKKFNENADSLKNLPLFSRRFLASGRDILYNENIYYAKDFLEPALKGVKFSYVTDTRPTSYIKNFIANSDIAIIEGMYADEAKLDMARKKHHMIWKESCELVNGNGVKKFILTHFSPSLQINENLINEFNNMHPTGVVGYDGYSIDMKFSNEKVIENENKDSIFNDKPLNINKVGLIFKFYQDNNYGKIKNVEAITDFKYLVFLGNGKVDTVFIYKSPQSMKEEFNDFYRYDDYYLFVRFM